MTVNLPAGIQYTTPFKVNEEAGRFEKLATGEAISAETLINQGLQYSQESLLDPVWGSDWDFDGKVSNDELSQTMAWSMSMVEGADFSRIQDIKGNFAQAIDVDNNGYISKEENFAFAVYQDSLGTLDGIVTEEEAGKANLNIIDKLSEAKSAIADIYNNVLGFGKKEEPVEEPKHEIVRGTGQLTEGATGEVGSNIGTYAEGNSNYDIIVAGENKYDLVNQETGDVINCVVSQKEDGSSEITMTQLGMTVTKDLVDDGNGAFTIKGEVGMGLKEVA